jgi:hypothetical protein
VTPSEGGRRNYEEAVKQADKKRYRISLTPKDEALSADQIKVQLKRHINPTDIRVGIKAIRTLREGRIIIETGTEEEMNTLSMEIDIKLGERLEVTRHRLSKPRLIIYNVSEEITTQNVATIIKAQNPEIQTDGEDTETKYKFKDRKGRYDIVLEVGQQLRQQILQTKIKIGWEICSVADFLSPTRCYKCSRYNHEHYECNGIETCSHCTAQHKLKECKAEAHEQRCIICITYNKCNKKRKISENHSALSKNCPSLHAVLARYRNNIEY